METRLFLGALIKGNHMKKILTLAAVAALTAGVSAYAANPFTDVSESDWAYLAVSDLSAQGVVEGYPDGTFKGESNVTRFEMAQIIARLMASEAKMNADQKAVVDKLAAEYADELVNLGVRVNNIENKVGNVSFTGDARVKMERKYKSATTGFKDYEDKFTGRLRLDVKAQANDKIAVKTRLVTSLNLESGKGLDVKVKRLHAEYKPFENAMIDIGRTSVKLGSGVWYDGAFDGATVIYEKGMFDVEAGYGRFRKINAEANSDQVKFFKVMKEDGTRTVDIEHNFTPNSEAVFVQGNVKLTEKVSVGGFATQFAKRNDNEKHSRFYGVNAKIMLSDNVSVDGEYIRHNTKYEKNHIPSLWYVGANVNYGAFDLSVRYFDMKSGICLGGTHVEGLKAVEDAEVGATFWQANGKVALANNIDLKAYYNFNLKGKKKLNGQDASAPLYNSWGVSVNYKF